MKQQEITLKVAQAIVKEGFPTEAFEGIVFDAEGNIVGKYEQEMKLPTYIDVWLWLWRSKIVELSLNYGMRYNDVDETLWCYPLDYHERSHPQMKYIIQEINEGCHGKCQSHGYNHEHADPENAIVSAVDFLVDNNLIHNNKHGREYIQDSKIW